MSCGPLRVMGGLPLVRNKLLRAGLRLQVSGEWAEKALPSPDSRNGQVDTLVHESRDSPRSFATVQVEP